MSDETKNQIDGLEVEKQAEDDNGNNPVPTPTTPASTASYFEKIIRYIPAGLITAHVSINGLLVENAPNPVWLHWSVFLVLWILVPFYVLYIPGQLQDKSVSKNFCVLAGVISFAVWAYAIDGSVIAVSFPEYYQPLYGSLLLIITTLILPVLEIVMKKIPFFKPEETDKN